MKFKKLLIAAVALLTATSCNGQQKNETTAATNQAVGAKNGKALVVFFSHAGDNYSVGNIEVGNTKIVADYISELTGADQFEIVTLVHDRRSKI